ncbi:MAG: LPS O-antigen chain length determinant protein WzzB [Legionellaceae bacterium]|nr:LPS O-antigen chain length determinant protein WzzB [Legionellaceae bacterium]
MSTQPQQLTYNDEIDLVEVIKTLWKHKWILILTTVLFGMSAFIILSFMPPVHQLQITLKAPFASQVAALDFSVLPESNRSLPSIKASEAFDIFCENASSQSMRQQFFNEVYWPQIMTNSSKKISKSAAYQQFNKDIKLRKNPKTDSFELTIKGQNPQLIQQSFTRYVELAERRSKEQIDRNLKTQLALKIRGLQAEIDMKRSLAKQERKDRLIQLEEAVKVASAVNQGNDKWIVLNQSDSKTEYTSTMYLLGAKALKLEMDNLQKRQSDDPFIPNFRTLFSTLSFYEHFKPEFGMVSLYRVDGDLTPPESLLSTKRTMLSLLALLLGFLLGCLLVFFRVTLNSKGK